jgi:hypothetical protein
MLGESERNSLCLANQTRLMLGRKHCKFKMMNVLNMDPEFVDPAQRFCSFPKDLGLVTGDRCKKGIM